jgi:hypothetical protein
VLLNGKTKDAPRMTSMSVASPQHGCQAANSSRWRSMGNGLWVLVGTDLGSTMRRAPLQFPIADSAKRGPNTARRALPYSLTMVPDTSSPGLRLEHPLVGRPRVPAPTGSSGPPPQTSAFYTLADFEFPKAPLLDPLVAVQQPREFHFSSAPRFNSTLRWLGFGARSEVIKRLQLAPSDMRRNIHRSPFRNTTGAIWRTCETCGLVRAKMRKCSGCRLAHYCSTTCQDQHWHQRHKFECCPDQSLPPGRMYICLPRFRMSSTL